MPIPDFSPVVPAWIDIDKLCPVTVRAGYDEIAASAAALIPAVAALSRRAAEVDVEPFGVRSDEELALWAVHSGHRKAWDALLLLQDLIGDVTESGGFADDEVRAAVRERYTDLIRETPKALREAAS